LSIVSLLFVNFIFCILSGQEMEKAQAKGDVAEEELRALEMDVTGKVDLKTRLNRCRMKALIVGLVYR